MISQEINKILAGEEGWINLFVDDDGVVHGDPPHNGNIDNMATPVPDYTTKLRACMGVSYILTLVVKFDFTNGELALFDRLGNKIRQHFMSDRNALAAALALRLAEIAKERRGC